MTDEQIAQVCHEANRAYCKLLNDFSQPPWEKAELWQRNSAIEGVRTAIADPAATPESMHAAWRSSKELDGWVFGKVKRPETKEHPCMISYSELPEEQRRKDSLFLAIVRALA